MFLIEILYLLFSSDYFILRAVQCETVVLCDVLVTGHVRLAPSLRMNDTVPPMPYMGFHGVYRVRLLLVYLHYTG